ncbi:MAG: Ig-like domain-containing protein, partial [Herbinix sp.]|nr:Ig-like domain-containing protein [Herbinix sp.]
ELTIKLGTDTLLDAKVSSGNSPEWSTSNSNVATVDSKGRITGIKKGRAYIYAKEDGTKVRCTVYVTD